MTFEEKKSPENVIGINQRSLDAWLEANVENFKAPGNYQLLKGGRSNLTYLVTDQNSQEIVLRRPPLSHVLATAHDMGREFRVIKALGSTNVPVPKAIAYCQDPQIIGAPFYVMSYIKGYILRDAAQTEKAFPSLNQREMIGRNLITVLADLHNLNPDEIGLVDYGKKEGYIIRQLNRWWGQFQASYDEGDLGGQTIQQVYETLLKKVPVEQKVAIVHGDYRLDNTVIGENSEVKAVLDWEISTLGDPLADLGLLMVYWVQKGDNNPLLTLAPTSLEGFLSREELVKIYDSLSEVSVENLDFYTAFGYWKLACILQGVFNRYRKGAHGSDSNDWAGFGSQVEYLANLAKEYAAKL
jgi:aminoglycoside phosphotransferase (APT) family kinase protein